MTRHYPKYYAVNDRPVKIVQLPDGGADALVLDWSTGAFIPDRSYFGRTMEHGKDIDSFTKEQFDTRVALLRVEIVNKLHASPLVWERTGNPMTPYATKVRDQTLTIRLNDFPAKPMYTMLAEGQEIMSMEDWPDAWVCPDPPQHLHDRLVKMPIKWSHTGDAFVQFTATAGDRTLTVRVNDFPDEPLYTLLSDGRKLVDLEEWPALWVAPEIPQHLVDLLVKTGKMPK